MKKMISITIDEELIDKAKKFFINVSEICNDALRERLNKTQVMIKNQPDKCEFCGRPGKKETIDNLNKSQNNLTWLYPDEKWICNSCLHSKSINIAH